MQTARALGRAVRAILCLLAMGAAAGGAWPATAPPPRPAGATAVAAASGWAVDWFDQVQRLDEFAAFLAEDARTQWRGATGDLMEWGRHALPQLDDALVDLRDAVAARAAAGDPVWRDLGRALAGWWPPTGSAGDGGAWIDPADLGRLVPRLPGLPDLATLSSLAGAPTALAGGGTGPIVPPAPGAAVDGPRAGSPAAPAGDGLIAGLPAPSGGDASPPGGAAVASAQPLPEPLSLIPDPAQRAEAALQGAGDGEPANPGSDEPAQGAEAGAQGAPAEGQGASSGDGTGSGGRDGGGAERTTEPAATGDRNGGSSGAGDAGGGEWIPAVASWYGPGFYGRPTASGETYTGREMTAAHRTMPFGTVLLVMYPETGRSVQVRINDRGPYVEGRDLDLSEAAAEALGMISAGVARVVYRVLRWGG